MTMQVVYSCLWKKALLLSKQLLVIGLTALPITMRLERIVTPVPAPVKAPEPIKTDPRSVRLKNFFSHLRCPVTYLADDFIHAADDNHLDWRLLPSISLVESSGGKAYKNNNMFGWKNGEQFFPTLRAGLHEVAFKLGRSRLYQDQDVKGKLHLYNPDERYADKVLTVMNRISPVVNLEPAQRVIRHQNEFVYVRN